ncbi:diguanylate cyclase [Photobacterium frigidiphilum]|uniref:diguanylate cyclase n=1 Tax=Photobacterium frigidiphilum TaxID=264736 RepID=UPI003D0DB72E
MKNSLIILVNSIVILFAISINIRNEIENTTSYLESNLSIIKSSLLTLAYRNERYAKYISLAVNNNNNQLGQSLVTVHHYPELNEFGFNRGQYKDNLLNGTLVGIGEPSPSALTDTFIFPTIDDLWAEKHHLNINYNYYYVSYLNEYFYVSSKYTSTFFKLPPNIFETQDYNEQRSYYKSEKELKKGFYFSQPYIDIVTKQKIFSIKSPIYSNDKIIGDIGVDVPLTSITSAITLPKALHSSIFIYLDAMSTQQEIILRKGLHIFWPIIDVQKTIDDFLHIHAEVDIRYVLRSAAPNIALVLILIILLNYLMMRVERHKIQQQTYKKEARTDLLTGLYNRRVLSSIVVNLIEQCRISYNAVSLIVIDANGFKAINDNYGHDIGDAALKHISSQIFLLSRSTDICIRLGGDEFCLILPYVTQAQALKLASRLESSISITRFCHHDIYTSITTSCTQIQADETIDNALIRADKQLYKNKRNRYKANKKTEKSHQDK